MPAPRNTPNQTTYLNSGRLDTFRVSGAELDEFLTLEDVPVRVPGTHGLGWSDELTAEGITELLE